MMREALGSWDEKIAWEQDVQFTLWFLCGVREMAVTPPPPRSLPSTLAVKGTP